MQDSSCILLPIGCTANACMFRFIELMRMTGCMRGRFQTRLGFRSNSASLGCRDVLGADMVCPDCIEFRAQQTLSCGGLSQCFTRQPLADHDVGQFPFDLALCLAIICDVHASSSPLLPPPNSYFGRMSLCMTISIFIRCWPLTSVRMTGNS